MRDDIIRLYDEFTHDRIDRRRFMKRLAGLAGGTAAAYGLLPLLANDYARAATVAPEDPRLVAGRVEYEADDGAFINGYLAWPKGGKDRLPAVLVIHENRGLNPHIEDVTRRLALAGFLALAPDALSRRGGTPANEDEAREWIGNLDPARARADYLTALAFLAKHKRSTGKVGCVGFCWGGGMAGRLATLSETLAASVVFYGGPPPVEEVPKIKAALLLHYAGLDARINERVPAFQAALDAAKVRYALHMYDGANHAFHNDTNTARYDAAAAVLAWQRTVEFLAKELG
jgi:carboxymethylenebutenolidase